MDTRTPSPDLPCGFDKINAISVMFLNAGRNRKNVWVKNDVLRRKPSLLRQNVIGSGADLDPSFERIGLPFFVEGHHHGGGATGAQALGFGDEVFNAPL